MNSWHILFKAQHMQILIPRSVIPEKKSKTYMAFYLTAFNLYIVHRNNDCICWVFFFLFSLYTYLGPEI